jgi:hypothetical protein
MYIVCRGVTIVHTVSQAPHGVFLVASNENVVEDDTVLLPFYETLATNNTMYHVSHVLLLF